VVRSTALYMKPLPQGPRRGIRTRTTATALVGLLLLTGCGDLTRPSAQATVGTEILREALVGLDDMPVGWEAVWDPAVNGSSPTATNPAIDAAVGRLATCVGEGAAVFLTDTEANVTGSTLIGTAGTGQTTVQTQVDSSAYAARGAASGLAQLADERECLAVYARERISASLDQPSLSVSAPTSTVLTEGLPEGVVAVRHDLSISNGSMTVPVSSTTFGAGAGNFVVLYDLSVIGGPAPEDLVRQLAELLAQRVKAVTDAL
jgi:hypothetical protein